MMHVVYYTETGEAFSIGSVLADPMPPEFSVYTCSDDEGPLLLSGGLRWDAENKTLGLSPGWTVQDGTIIPPAPGETDFLDYEQEPA